MKIFQAIIDSPAVLIVKAAQIQGLYVDRYSLSKDAPERIITEEGLSQHSTHNHGRSQSGWTKKPVLKFLSSTGEITSADIWNTIETNMSEGCGAYFM